jgi:hypothetical protein
MAENDILVAQEALKAEALRALSGQGVVRCVVIWHGEGKTHRPYSAVVCLARSTSSSNTLPERHAPFAASRACRCRGSSQKNLYLLQCQTLLTDLGPTRKTRQAHERAARVLSFTLKIRPEPVSLDSVQMANSLPIHRRATQ